MPNAFVHAELNTSDLGKAKGFYGSLFAWDLKDLDMGPMGTYTLIGVGSGTGGGMAKNPCPDGTSHWMPYVHVDDVTASTAKAKALGGEVLVDVTEIPNTGWMSIIKDPTGAVLGIFKPKM